MDWSSLLSNHRRGKAPARHDQSRSAFDQDYDRIIFSHPFRRLQDKTQVHPLPDDDFVHTRLTHSLEVSSVGRSLGKSVGKVLLERHRQKLSEFSIHDLGAIVGAAALCHDIGNPPFGHSGEKAISEFYCYGEGKIIRQHVTEAQWKDLLSFEGNAQGFRLLNKNSYQGLQLTAATLAAFTKYPRPSVLEDPDPRRRSQKKYGYFQAEKMIIGEVAEECGLLSVGENVWVRHPLAFLVEAADDICYHLIDLEDGCRLGLISFDETRELFRTLLGERYNDQKLSRIPSREEKIGALRALAIGKLIEECTECFLDHEQDLLSGSFDTALTDEIYSTGILQEIIDVSVKKIYRSQQVLGTEVAGFEVLPGLLQAFGHAAISNNGSSSGTAGHRIHIRLMPEDIRRELEEAGSDHYQLLMVVNDFVSGLTDTHAISLFRKIKGISLGNR